MGSPASPIFCDIVVQDLELNCFDKVDFDIPIYVRYVDDSFMVLPKSKVDYIVDLFNSQDPHLKFTFELEKDNKLAFLDTEVIKRENKIITNWYQKETFSGRVLHFYSYHPIHQKRAMVFNLVDKAVLLADKDFHFDNLAKVTQILTNNCYPKKFIQANMKRRMNVINSRPDENVEQERRPWIVIPHINKTTEIICKKLKQFDLNIINSVDNKLTGIIVKGKDHTIKDNQTHIVYQIDCMDRNCKNVYIGQSKRKLSTRKKEHMDYIRKQAKYHNVVTEHRKNTGHEFNWEKAKILHKEVHKNKREIAEMCYIKNNLNCINAQTDTDKLRAAYNMILMH